MTNAHETALALRYLTPTASFSVAEMPDGSALVEWLDATVKQPTKTAISDALPEATYAAVCRVVEAERHEAYTAAGGPDSTFLRYQRGDATEQEWLDAVQAVKDAHPYPEPV